MVEVTPKGFVVPVNPEVQDYEEITLDGTFGVEVCIDAEKLNLSNVYTEDLNVSNVIAEEFNVCSKYKY
jgi:hypothetical protein